MITLESNAMCCDLWRAKIHRANRAQRVKMDTVSFKLRFKFVFNKIIFFLKRFVNRKQFHMHMSRRFPRCTLWLRLLHRWILQKRWHVPDWDRHPKMWLQAWLRRKVLRDQHQRVRLNTVPEQRIVHRFDCCLWMRLHWNWFHWHQLRNWHRWMSDRKHLVWWSRNLHQHPRILQVKTKFLNNFQHFKINFHPPDVSATKECAAPNAISTIHVKTMNNHHAWTGRHALKLAQHSLITSANALKVS